MSKKAEIFYFALPELWKKEEKLEWFRTTQFRNIPFERITPDKNHNWIHLAEDNDWDSLLPICSKEVKAGKSKEAIFELFSLGVVTARDEWVYDFDSENLKTKVKFFCALFENEKIRWQNSDKNMLTHRLANVALAHKIGTLRDVPMSSVPCWVFVC
jgi:predicted helicase